MNDYKNKKIVFYSLVRGVGSSTIAYQLSRLLRLPLYQENEFDLVKHLKTVIDSSKHTVGYLSDLLFEEEDGAIYDLDEPHKEYISIATDIIVLANNSYLDVLKVVATLKKLEKYNLSRVQVHVVFNRLQNGASNREKKYTRESKLTILANTEIKNIKFSYIRTNVLYYRQIREGSFFMSSLFKKKEKINDFFYNKKFNEYPYEERETYLLKKNELFINYFHRLSYVEYPIHLRLLFLNKYERKDFDFSDIPEYDEIYERLKEVDIEHQEEVEDKFYSDKIANKIYNRDYLRISPVVIKDMFLLLYNLNIYPHEEKINKKYIKEK